MAQQEGRKVEQEEKAAETINELIGALQRKVAVDGLNGDSRMQYIIMTEQGQLVTMKMNDVMANRVIKVLKTMTKGR